MAYSKIKTRLTINRESDPNPVSLNDRVAALPLVELKNIKISEDSENYYIDMDIQLETRSELYRNPRDILSQSFNLSVITLDKPEQLDTKKQLANFLNGNIQKINKIDVAMRSLVNGNISPAVNKKANGNDIYNYNHILKVKKTQDLSVMCFTEYPSKTKYTSAKIGNVATKNLVLSSAIQVDPQIVDETSKDFSEYLDFEIINTNKNDKKCYFSDLFSSFDKDEFSKFMFFWDSISFLAESSNFGNVLNNCSIEKSKQKMILDSKISEIKILRKRINLNLGDSTKFSRNEKEEVIVTSSDTPDPKKAALLHRKVVDSQEREVCELAEIESMSFSENLRFIAVNDYQSNRINNGMYQYGVDIRLEDGILKFLLESLSRLSENTKILQNLYSQKVQMSKKSVNVTLAAAPSIAAVSSTLEILFSLRQTTETSMRYITNKFISSLNTATGVNTLINFHNQLSRKISMAIGSRGLTPTTIEGGSRSYNKTNSDLFFLSTSHYFNNYCDFSKLKKHKIDYFEIKDQISLGTAGYSVSSLQERFFDELKKLISIDTSLEDTDFASIKEKIYKDNVGSSKSKTLKEDLYDFQATYCAYLSPSTKKLEKDNEEWDFQNYNKNGLSLAYELQNMGISLKKKSNGVQSKESSEELLGDNNQISSECLTNQDVSRSYENLAEFETVINNSSAVSNGVIKYYNNINLTKSDFDIENPKNLVVKQDLKNLPNHIRSLAGSRSDLSRNQWLNLDNDFLSDPNTTNMLKENFSNLIRIEVLDSLGEDENGKPMTKAPQFRLLTNDDLNSLQAGELLFCRTYKYQDLSAAVGMENEKEKQNNDYYNQYFIISKEELQKTDLIVS